MKKSNVVIWTILCLMLSGSALADYASTVLADNPLSYWRFEDSSSANGATCTDSATRAYKNGTYINKAGSSSSVADIALVSGIQGQAAEFHGSVSGGGGNCIDVYDGSSYPYSLSKDSSGSALQTVTIELWMNSTVTSSYARLLQHNGSNSTTDGYGIGSYPSAITVIGGNSTWYTGTGNVFDGNWHYIAVTYQLIADSTDGIADLYEYVYIDGVGKWGNTIEDGSLAFSYSRLTLGSEGNRWYMYNGYVGLLDEVAIYDSALSASQVAAHYAAGIIPEPATLSLLGLGAVSLLRRKK